MAEEVERSLLQETISTKLEIPYDEVGHDAETEYPTDDHKVSEELQSEQNLPETPERYSC